ncbi:hypothetical protein E3N88_38677 [Mikania micrantha]|uniref:Uncharacterized protein n=1 Tax=Mikania micrantha TaxID=192012 RepID=A0A5N6LUY1_9ASTR|nr:hypothetical protein E3N88_38677 [Mikania micrantha]
MDWSRYATALSESLRVTRRKPGVDTLESHRVLEAINTLKNRLQPFPGPATSTTTRILAYKDAFWCLMCIEAHKHNNRVTNDSSSLTSQHTHSVEHTNTWSCMDYNTPQNTYLHLYDYRSLLAGLLAFTVVNTT